MHRHPSLLDTHGTRTACLTPATEKCQFETEKCQFETEKCLFFAGIAGASIAAGGVAVGGTPVYYYFGTGCSPLKCSGNPGVNCRISQA
jgi:hypothetical protein